MFPKEDQENDILPVLNLKQKVDRKTKQVECMVDYGKVQTNSPPCMKKGIKILLKERGSRLCDEQRLEDELKNMEDVFVANEYDRKLVKKYMKKDEWGDKAW